MPLATDVAADYEASLTDKDEYRCLRSRTYRIYELVNAKCTLIFYSGILLKKSPEVKRQR